MIAERSRVLSRVKPGGVLVLAGILATQFERVVAAYAECGMRLVATKAEKEWQSGSFAWEAGIQSGKRKARERDLSGS